MPNYLSKVLYILAGKRRQLTWLLLAFIFSSLLEAAGIGLIGPFLSIVSDPSIVERQPLLSALLISGLGLQTNQEIVVWTAILVIGVFVIKSVIYFLCRFYIFRFSYRQKRDLQTLLVRTYLHVPYLFHAKRNSASSINNIIAETNQFTVNCLIPLLEMTSNFIVIGVLLWLLYQTSPLLLGLALGILLPFFVVFAQLSRRARHWGRMRSETQQKIIRAINHGLGGLKETKVIGCETYFEQDLRHHAGQYAQAAMLFDSFQLLPRISIESVFVIFLISFVLIFQVFMGRTSDEMMSVTSVFAIASIRMIPAASQTMNAMGRMRASSYALNMLYRDLTQIEQYQEGSTSLAQTIEARRASSARLLSHDWHQIVLKDISFRYPETTQPAIDRLSLTINRGESIAFMGRSGAGKTTLVDILLGLITPSSGEIYLDDTSIYSDLRAWQNLVGYIPQTIFLTDQTIEQNVAFGVPRDQIDMERVHQAVRLAQLEDLIQQLPDGLSTPVGERGVRLSGGQRQRIGIARALYHQREILVLDEATSALDSETEKLVSDAINALSGSKTLVIIAHRLSTIENCDRVYLLENGQIAKSGKLRDVAAVG
ncbi:MAG: ABC transporter ATP-binding protein [Leptolyngbya sp. SIO4C1]|nr:ABC transporter ATP-binding protein [Leptolyngbya sp. SIO4C1]